MAPTPNGADAITIACASRMESRSFGARRTRTESWQLADTSLLRGEGLRQRNEAIRQRPALAARLIGIAVDPEALASQPVTEVIHPARAEHCGVSGNKAFAEVHVGGLCRASRKERTHSDVAVMHHGPAQE